MLDELQSSFNLEPTTRSLALPLAVGSWWVKQAHLILTTAVWWNIFGHFWTSLFHSRTIIMQTITERSSEKQTNVTSFLWWQTCPPSCTCSYRTHSVSPQITKGWWRWRSHGSRRGGGSRTIAFAHGLLEARSVVWFVCRGVFSIQVFSTHRTCSMLSSRYREKRRHEN